MLLIYSKILSSFLILSCCISYAQLTVTNAPPYNSPAYLVQNVLLNAGITVSNIKFNGVSGIPSGANAQMIGYFSGNSNIGIPTGVILATGNINVAEGPNDSTKAGNDNFTSGDQDLNALAGDSTFNAAVLEFDFESQTDGISFKYVFASEEYNEYVCSEYNDVFAFFVSGPGIAGKKNIALLPSTSVPVAINTINNGKIGTAGTQNGCGGTGDPGLKNSVYFVDNEALGQQSVQYDGFTTVLKAEIDILPCNIYHLKMAIADVGDGIFDSGVFLEAASFGSKGVQVQVGQMGISSAIIAEGCGPLKFTFSRPNPVTNPLTIKFIISGGAVNGVDYSFLLDSVVIPAGQKAVDIYINPFFDGISEGDETITLTIPANLTNNTCIDDEESSVVVIIKNTDPINITLGNDIFLCPGESALLASAVTGGVQPYTYTWNTGDNKATLSVKPQQTSTYSVTVSDNCQTGSDMDSVTVHIADAYISTATSFTTYEGCMDGAVTFARPDSIGDMTIFYTISGTALNGTDYNYINDSVIIKNGEHSATIGIDPLPDTLSENDEPVDIAIKNISGLTLCRDSAATIVIKNVNPVKVNAGDDTVVCIVSDADLNLRDVSGGTGAFSYRWSRLSRDGDSLSNSSSARIKALSEQYYFLTATDTCDNSATDSVLVDVTGVGIYGDTLSVEGCRNARIGVFRSDSAGNQVINFTVGGTAMNIIDFYAVGGSITIPDGFTEAYVNISPILDLISEGDEGVTITLDPELSGRVCPDSIASVTIKDVPKLELKAMDDLLICNEQILLTATMTGGYGKISYIWESEGSILPNPLVNPDRTTRYKITAGDSCATQSATDEVVIEVDCRFYFNIPNAFTPNGDRTNDIFNGKGRNFQKYSMHIYNRWGDEIFSTDDAEQGWDGRANNGDSLAQQDIYVYIIEVTDLTGFPHKHVGRVALINP